MDNTPFFTQDTIAFGILMLTLGFVFYTSTSENSRWKKFYKYIPVSVDVNPAIVLVLHGCTQGAEEIA